MKAPALWIKRLWRGGDKDVSTSTAHCSEAAPIPLNAACRAEDELNTPMWFHADAIEFRAAVLLSQVKLAQPKLWCAVLLMFHVAQWTVLRRIRARRLVSFLILYFFKPVLTNIKAIWHEKRAFYAGSRKFNCSSRNLGTGENLAKDDAASYEAEISELAIKDGLSPESAPADSKKNSFLAIPLTTSPAFRQQYRVTFIGPWNYDNGLGVASRGYLSALWRSGFKLNIHPVCRPFHVHNVIAPTTSVCSFSGPADLVLIHLNPDAWDPLLTDEQREIIANGGRRAGLWVWETENVPKHWHTILGKVDAVWVPSRFCASSFAEMTKIPIAIVPYVVPVPPTRSDITQLQVLRKEIEVPAEKHIILYAFDASSYLVRKNPLALLRAFERSRLAESDWVLVLKTKNLSDTREEGQRLRRAVHGRSDVVLINRAFGQSKMSNLMRIADIYASPHRAEGFGLTIAEAMALGKPVVATNYGGSCDFLDEVCGYPVRRKLSPLQARHGPYEKDVVWASIDEANMADLLRAAAGCIISGDHRIGAMARSRIQQQLSPEAVSLALRASTLQLLRTE